MKNFSSRTKKLTIAFTIAVFAGLVLKSTVYAYYVTPGTPCNPGDCLGWINPSSGQWCQPNGTSGELTLGGVVCDCNNGVWENCGGGGGGGGSGSGAIYNPLVAVQGITALANYIGTFWQAAYIVVGLLVLAYLLFGGILYITASGEKDAIEKAQKIITNAIIGLVILAASYPIIKIIEVVFGINILQITWPTV